MLPESCNRRGDRSLFVGGSRRNETCAGSRSWPASRW
jgi:hypothetical protein